METTDKELLKKQAVEACQKWYATGLEKFPQENRPLEVRFDLGGGTAGQAITGINMNPAIRINIYLLVEHPEEMFDDTIPHEIAHVIANGFFREIAPQGCGHGDLWKLVMLKFGKKPTRCHDMEVSHLKYKRATDDSPVEAF